MVIVELIGSLSLAIAFVSAVLWTIIHMRNKQNEVVYIHDQPLNDIVRPGVIRNHPPEDVNRSLAVLPFQAFKATLAITPSPTTTIGHGEPSTVTNVIDQTVVSLSSIKYGIQWTFPHDEDTQSELQKSSDDEPVDSLSFGDQTIRVRNLIEKFENNPLGKISWKEKTKPTESDITSIDTNFDSETIQTDLNQNQHKISHHSSISNLDITIPSNLSSSIDLEQFECFSTTSNLSEFLNTN